VRRAVAIDSTLQAQKDYLATNKHEEPPRWNGCCANSTGQANLYMSKDPCFVCKATYHTQNSVEKSVGLEVHWGQRLAKGREKFLVSDPDLSGEFQKFSARATIAFTMDFTAGFLVLFLKKYRGIHILSTEFKNTRYHE
jgi:hypothetical protein